MARFSATRASCTLYPLLLSGARVLQSGSGGLLRAFLVHRLSLEGLLGFR